MCGVWQVWTFSGSLLAKDDTDRKQIVANPKRCTEATGGGAGSVQEDGPWKVV